MSATVDQYKLLLEAETIDLNRLADLARHGIPSKIRGDVWKFLLTTYRNEKSFRRHKEYKEIDKSYPSLDVKKKISQQVKRLFSKVPLFSEEDTLKKMASCLHAYLNYNPDAGFQDGMIALLAPLVNCIKSEEEMFWCYNGLMQRIEDFVTPVTLTDTLSKFMMYLRSVSPDLFQHFEEEELTFEWAASWFQFLLSRELPLDCVMRLWDTYFAGPDGLRLHIYVCLAILVNCSEDLMELDVAEMKGFLQHLPTMDMDEIISQALNIREEVKSYDQ